MKTKELIEALKMDAEWAEGHKEGTPITLRDDLVEVARILGEMISFFEGNCIDCKYGNTHARDNHCYTCIYGLGNVKDKTNHWTPFWEEE